MPASSDARRSELGWGLALLVAVLLVLAVLTGSFGPREVAQVGTRLVGSLLVLALVAVALLSRLRHSPRLATWIHVLAATAALVTYYNFGSFYRGSLVNEHEMFHYYLGAKYFPELGYDGLYLASLAADRVDRPEQPVQRRIRDLRTNLLVPTAKLGPAVGAVRARFSDERFEAFRADHREFIERIADPAVRSLRRDHGYNPTPAWTFVAQGFTSWLAPDRGSLSLLACVDFVLLALAFAAIGRTYGLRVMCLSIAVLGLGFGWRFYYIGGAFFRLDWLAAITGAVCLLERRRFAWAGALLGYAAAVRGFPALLMLGPGVLAVQTLIRRQSFRWVFEIGVGFTVVLALGFAAGALAGRGADGWLEFATNIRGHSELAPPNRVGFASVVLNAPALVAATVSTGSPDLAPWTGRKVERIREERRAARLAAQAAFLALLLVALWRTASLAKAAILSMAAIFALVPLGSYYWVMLLLVPIRGGPWAVLGLLALSTGMKGIQLASDSETTRYAIKSIGLTVFFLLWTATAFFPHGKPPDSRPPTGPS